jgi:rRNA maturation endonuclease Nob1
MSELVERHYTVCEECGAHYQHSPDNWINPSGFDYCPNCGGASIKDVVKEVDIGFIPEKP